MNRLKNLMQVIYDTNIIVYYLFPEGNIEYHYTLAMKKIN